MARTLRTFLLISRALRAAMEPIETWSSLSADVGIESTLAGWARPFSSDASAAAVTCAIIRPDWSPPRRVRNAGSPLSAGLTSRSVRRSLIAASWASAMHSRSHAMATGAP